MEFMAKLRSGETDINSYRIKGTENIIRVGDCVLIRPSDARKPKYVACVEKFEKDNNNNVNVHVRWYYRPEEAFGGRRIFHGANELFLTDHYDVKSADVIEGKCVVHPFNDYTKIDNPGPKDFYCRFEYKVDTQVFTPDDVQV
ncbi:PREDICTED: chromatin remodeling protein EBS-like [Lupinus angustifolius]|nr:PREDICTED: chromatin remodeling protein EBS-like [Lupinus angustifolius]